VKYKIENAKPKKLKKKNIKKFEWKKGRRNLKKKINRKITIFERKEKLCPFRSYNPITNIYIAKKKRKN